MKILVLGAGVIGVTTAYQLLKDGHQVAVVARRDSAGDAPRARRFFGLGRQTNLYFNTGHGHMDWTMANGAARIAADLIAGRQPAVELTGMTLR